MIALTSTNVLTNCIKLILNQTGNYILTKRVIDVRPQASSTLIFVCPVVYWCPVVTLLLQIILRLSG